MRAVLAVLSGVVLCSSVSFASTPEQRGTDREGALRLLHSLNERIQRLGYERAIAEAEQPELAQPLVHALPARPGDCWTFPNICAPGGTDPVGLEIRDDAIQILMTEVLFQTLRFFKVTFTFSKTSPTEWAFNVTNPVVGADFQDLDSPLVLRAVTQFRRFLIGLLCNNPNPKNVLAMMNRFDVGARFRWDMAWALLGNDLPETPNKYMRFSEQWKRFTAALDALESGSPINIYDPTGTTWGGQVDPGAATGPDRGRSIGRIAKEAVDIIRTVGNIATAIIDLYCKIDLSTDSAKERDKKEVVYKLLQLKKDMYSRYAQLRPALDAMGAQATRKLRRPISFYPPGVGKKK